MSEADDRTSRSRSEPMRPTRSGFTVLIAGSLFALGAGSVWVGGHRAGPSPEAPTDPAEAVVFRAKRYQTKGPCIKTDDAWEYLAGVGFEVTEILRGDLPVKRLQVRPLTRIGHLEHPGDGWTYTLRLTPSAETRAQ